MGRQRKEYTADPFKTGPFKLSKKRDDWATYLKQLATVFESMSTLPNFEEDNSVFVFSDYGGDHSGASFNTYSFLIVSADKIGVFQHHMAELRERYKLGSKEISYKNLGHGPTKRSLKEYLEVADGCIHGMILTVCIEKSIVSMFGPDKKSAKENLQQLSDQIGAGKWHEFKLERMYRIFGILVLLLDLTTTSDQKVLWQSDTDQINEEGRAANFGDSQRHLYSFLREFTDKDYPLLGFAKTFKEGSHFTDLLSLADLAAGMVQDMLSDKYFGKKLLVNEERAEICRWLGRQSKFLEKKFIAVVKRDDLIYFEPVYIEQIG